jgi:sulfite reductase beta subunit-like hemoprotein
MKRVATSASRYYFTSERGGSRERRQEGFDVARIDDVIDRLKVELPVSRRSDTRFTDLLKRVGLVRSSAD